MIGKITLGCDSNWTVGLHRNVNSNSMALLVAAWTLDFSFPFRGNVAEWNRFLNFQQGRDRSCDCRLRAQEPTQSLKQARQPYIESQAGPPFRDGSGRSSEGKNLFLPKTACQKEDASFQFVERSFFW